mmetsp:Transcript_12551/g.22371  ORF Transcript_12551/g.22371 Transcript_12551/m.22371 type:complete len:103 (-) Transcript_12551:34-342(-)
MGNPEGLDWASGGAPTLGTCRGALLGSAAVGSDVASISSDNRGELLGEDINAGSSSETFSRCGDEDDCRILRLEKAICVRNFCDIIAMELSALLKLSSRSEL